MKKFYLVAGAFLFTAGAMAQNVNKLSAIKNFGFETRATQNVDRAEGDEIWADEFDVQGNWTIGNEGTPQDWEFSTTGPTGSFSNGMGAIASTSAANGFAMYDSDAIGSGATSQDAWIAWNGTGGAISTTGIGAVTLEFQSYYRNFQGACYVEISTDMGATWPLANQFQVHADVATNNDSGNPDLVSINISSIAANQADVRIRFRYVGGWDYAWMVDDVRLIETWDNDLQIGRAFGVMGPQNLDYHFIPYSQTSPITYTAEVCNNGAASQTQTKLNAMISNSESASLTSNNFPLAVAACDSISTNSSFTPSAGEGTYDVAVYFDSENSEDVTNNDTTYLPFYLTVGAYSRDNGIVSGNISNVSSQPGQPFKIGNVMDIMADDYSKHIEVGIADNNGLSVGQTIYAEVQKWNETTGNYEYYAQTLDYTISAGDEQSIVTLTFNSIIEFTAGDNILLLVGHNGGVDINSDGQTDEVAFLMAQPTFDGSVLGYTADGNPFQLTNPSAIMARLNFYLEGIEEKESVLNYVSAYPNPSNEYTNVNFTLTKAAQVDIEIIDINGKVVYTSNQGTLAAGNYTEALNISNLTNGIYYCNFNVNGLITTNKFVVSHK